MEGVLKARTNCSSLLVRTVGRMLKNVEKKIFTSFVLTADHARPPCAHH
jgi:hypothetical protein